MTARRIGGRWFDVYVDPAARTVRFVQVEDKRPPLPTCPWWDAAKENA